ncbi:MAG TPA: CHASE sensor domain-containing protein, partial [Dehalococcoidia bacterium]|nr:CHASE sensor domain-containing protein [Dehalococcoidia bacterium]
MSIFVENLSIKRKLMLITMLTITAALVIASVGFLLYDLTAFRRAMASDLTTTGQMIGSNSTAALTFKDEKAAADILAALRAKDGIEAAGIYTAPDGRLLARYLRQGASADSLPARPQPSGHIFEGNKLRVFQNIAWKGQWVGTLYLQSGMQPWYARLRRYVGMVVVVALGAECVTLLLLSRLQGVISGPIL